MIMILTKNYIIEGNILRKGTQITLKESVDNITDEEIKMLERTPTMTVYRSMQYIGGQLLPPMSAKTKSGGMRLGSILGKWEKAVEDPSLVKDGYFVLNKGNGSSISARYNPYFHCAEDMLNDQFSSAEERPNLVVVECEIPTFELKGEYKAEGAKDSVGEQKWKCGVVQSQFKKYRTIYLSRYIKPIRIVPNSEVAENIIKEIGNRNIVFPSNVITPDLRIELENRGVEFVETSPRGVILEGEFEGMNYSQVYGGKK